MERLYSTNGIWSITKVNFPCTDDSDDSHLIQARSRTKFTSVRSMLTYLFPFLSIRDFVRDARFGRVDYYGYSSMNIFGSRSTDQLWISVKTQFMVTRVRDGLK